MKYLSILFSGLFILSSCVKNNPEPVWLELNQWDLKVNLAATDDAGQLTHNLSDAWVYVDNKLIGCFELPCKIPVQANGKNIHVQIYPAIRNNGIAATKKIYPFVEPIDEVVNLVAGETYTPDMTTRYFAGTQFEIEDFNDATIKLEESDNSISTALLSYDNQPNEMLPNGQNYAHIQLSTNTSLFEAHTTLETFVPSAGKEIYLELDYRNTNGLLTGVMLYDNNSSAIHPNILVNPQNESDLKWKKIYIDLKEIVATAAGSGNLEIYLKAQLESGKSNSDIYIDNIKVVRL